MALIDTSRLLFSDEYEVTQKISVRHSTVGDVLRLGERRYFHILHTLTSIPSDEKWLLHTKGINWMDISDLEFFAMLAPSLKPEDSQIFFPGLDFSKFRLYKQDDGLLLFADKANGITIDKFSHMKMMECLCTIHKIKKKVEIAGNEHTRQVLLEDDKLRYERALAKADMQEYKSTLVPLISALINREGFKYNYNTVGELRFGQFLDAAARVQMIVATDQLIQGVYAGNVDAKKLDKKKFDWTREI